MLHSRRSFLQIASAAIVVPVIARSAIFPQLIVPGIKRVEGVTSAELLAGNARFADAIFGPGLNWGISHGIHVAADTALPYGSRYEIRTVALSRDEMWNLTRGVFKRDGIACVWLSDAGMQSHRWTAEQLEGSRLIDTGVTEEHRTGQVQSYLGDVLVT